MELRCYLCIAKHAANTTDKPVIVQPASTIIDGTALCFAHAEHLARETDKFREMGLLRR